MFKINRMAEMDALGYSINHTLRGMEQKEAFLYSLYKEVMQIAVNVINDSDSKTLADTLDGYLQKTQLDHETRLSVFDYLAHFIERFIMRCKMMEIPDEMQYVFEMKDNKLYSGKDVIKIDIYGTYNVLDGLISKGTQKEITPWKDDVIDNPTVEDFDSALAFDQKVALLASEYKRPQPSFWIGDEVADEDKE